MAAILSADFILKLYLFFVLAVWIKRAFWLSRFRKTQPPLKPGPAAIASKGRVSIIVPARDEERNIPNCLYHLFKQNYPDFEIIVVDDRSTDRTPHLLENFEKLAPCPFKIVRVEKLPPGWTGKNYAMQTGSKAASGSWLLFTDADTTHTPQSVAGAVGFASEKKIDFLTLAPRLLSLTFWEKTVQPIAVSSLALWFDGTRLNEEGNQTVLANGQFILVRKEAYEKVGGNESVKNEVIEDVELAKQIRGAGFSVRFMNGTRLYATRMYTSLKEIHAGWTRIFTHLFQKNIWALTHKIFLFIFFSILPFVALAVDTDFLSVLVCGLIIALRWAGNRMMKDNPWHAFLHPLGSMVMVWILFTCVFRILSGQKSAWRGNYY
ncbi:MAG: glycosyltransferase [Candidatus Omnitrophica bacterium]|nr:glycosyltransferase [Candidatus Omnitrophota bacterium]